MADINIDKRTVPAISRNGRNYNSEGTTINSGGSTSGSSSQTEYSATNGITLIGTTLSLGGALIANTSITGAYTLSIAKISLNTLTKTGTELITNLNADMLDGYHASSFSLSSHTHSYEPTITGGTTLQYWRGDKTWQTLDTFSVVESTNLYFTTARARTSISLTTTGTSGAATYNSSTGVLNIPSYAAGGTGTVTSVAMTVPTGLSIAGSPITTSGTLALTLTSGYSIPTTANQTNWSTAYGWGNHAGLYSLLSHNHTGTYDNYSGWSITAEGVTNTINGVNGATYKGVEFAAGLNVTITSDTNLAGQSRITFDVASGQPLDADLTAIAGLAGTSGYLKKTAANTWSLDTSSYQPLDLDLSAIGALAGTTGYLKKTAANTWTLDTSTFGTGTVTSVTAGNGMTQSGTSTINPTLNIVSHAGTAGSIGTINVGADAIGVSLGTTSTTAAAGNHTHAYDNYVSWQAQVGATTLDITAGSWLKYTAGTGIGLAFDTGTHSITITNTGAALSNSTELLASDIALTTINTWYDIKSFSLPAGTYMIMAQMAVTNTTQTAAIISSKIYNGVTNYSSASDTIGTTFARTSTIHQHAIITIAATTTIYFAACSNVTGSIVDATLTTNSAGATTTKFSYIRLS